MTFSLQHRLNGLVSCLGPMCLGHESSGIIVRLGANVAAKAEAATQAAKKLDLDGGEARQVVGKRALDIGMNVTMEPGVTCRMCVDCRGGQYQVSSAYDLCAWHESGTGDQ